jgi:hypothetical protein
MLTKVENAKVLTKTFARHFYFFLVLSLDKDFSSQTGNTNLVLMLPIK